jgi:hypothetical protein
MNQEEEALEEICLLTLWSLTSNLHNCEEEHILLFNPLEIRYGLGTPGHIFLK